MTHRLHHLEIHSFVLMSNHYHLIASTPESNISQCMHRFAGRVSQRLNEKGNRINETFAGRHFKTVLDHPNYFLNAYKYNYRNPVEAGLCRVVEEYPYSTLYGLLGQSKLLIPVTPYPAFIDKLEDELLWLNEKPNEVHMEAVRFALKRPHFRAKKARSSNKTIMSENDIL